MINRGCGLYWVLVIDIRTGVLSERNIIVTHVYGHSLSRLWYYIASHSLCLIKLLIQTQVGNLTNKILKLPKRINTEWQRKRNHLIKFEKNNFFILIFASLLGYPESFRTYLTLAFIAVVELLLNILTRALWIKCLYLFQGNWCL